MKPTSERPLADPQGASVCKRPEGQKSMGLGAEEAFSLSLKAGTPREEGKGQGMGLPQKNHFHWGEGSSSEDNWEPGLAAWKNLEPEGKQVRQQQRLTWAVWG